ncbi:MAG: T9SS type A sorting domain-containing protein [Bacteroidota bacterium]
MHRPYPLHRLGLLAVALALAGWLSPAQAQSCTTNWTNAAGGNFSNAANWSAGVPGPSSDACIILAGTYVVTLDVNASVNRLTLGRTSGAGTQTLRNASRFLTLASASTVRARGVYDWQGGTVNGAGPLTNNGLLALSTSGTKDIGGGTTIRNEALTTMAGTGALRFLGGASQFVNAAGATFDLQSDADFSNFNGGNTFTNDGLFRKSGGTAQSILSNGPVAFNNNATVVAETGTIRFDGAGTHDNPTFTAAAGAEVYLNGGVQTIVGTISGNPAGTVRMDAGATLQADLPGIELDFGGTGFAWQGGNVGGDVTSAGLLRLTTSGLKDLNGNATLTNEGLVEMTDTGALRFIGGASQFVNAAGATFDLQSDADFSNFNGGNTFTNNGTFRKSGGTGLSLLSNGAVAFNNNALVQAQTGTIRFDGAGTHDNPTFTAAAGAEVYFNGGVQTIVGTISGNPAGTVRMDTGATLAGGTVDFGGTGFEWQSGNVGTVTNAGLLRLTTTGTKDLNGNATLTNEGLVEMTDLGVLRFLGGASQFVNAAGATFDLQSDADFSNFNGGNTFTNDGLFRKSGGTGQSILSNGAVAFNNNALVQAQTGTIRFDGNSTHEDATFTAAADAEVYFNGGLHTIVGTISGNPAGTVRMDAGATLAGGTVDFGGTGFAWQSGNVGTVTNAGLLRLTTTGTKDINGNATLTNEGLVEMTDTGALRFLGGASQFVNAASGTFDIQGDADFSIFNGGNVFTNNGLFRKSSGTGTSSVSGGITFNNNAGSTVSVESGELDVNGAFNHAAGALIQGDGTFDVINSAFAQLGDTGPGTSPGTLAWQNNWAPDAAATLFIEIGGGDPPTAGEDYDQLAVAGNATLAGTLELSVAVGDAPAIGDVYTILTAGGELTGTFDAVEGPFGYTFDIDIDEDADQVTVEVLTVPNFDLVAVNTDPTGDPVVVAKPGAIDFAYVVTNNTTAPISGDVFFEAKLGAATLAQGVILSGTLPANASSPALSFTQGIPGFAPNGTYTYSVKIGQFPNTVVDQVDFTVIVTSGSREVESGDGMWTLSAATPWLGADGAVLMAVSDRPVEVVGAETAGAETDKPVEASSSAVPEAFGLAAAYPNPFRAQTTFGLDVPEAGRVAVAVYDALGRRVAVLLNEEVEAATHRVVWDASGLPSGVYLVRATGAGQAAMQRVTLVR